MNLFSKKLPAWLLLAALVVVGAGAATGLVLKDQIDGTTTIAVSQALSVTSVTGGGDADEFLGTIDDDGMAWAAHFEANNGDTLSLVVTVANQGGSDDIVTMLTLDVPEGITVNIESDVNENTVQVAHHQWKFPVPGGSDNTLIITIALEDALATGFYTITGTMVPLNV